MTKKHENAKWHIILQNLFMDTNHAIISNELTQNDD